MESKEEVLARGDSDGLRQQQQRYRGSHDGDTQSEGLDGVKNNSEDFSHKTRSFRACVLARSDNQNNTTDTETSLRILFLRRAHLPLANSRFTPNENWVI